MNRYHFAYKPTSGQVDKEAEEMIQPAISQGENKKKMHTKKVVFQTKRLRLSKSGLKKKKYRNG